MENRDLIKFSGKSSDYTSRLLLSTSARYSYSVRVELGCMGAAACATAAMMAWAELGRGTLMNGNLSASRKYGTEIWGCRLFNIV